MGILNNLGYFDETEKKKKAPDWKPALNEILNDDEKSELFGKILTLNGRDALKQKIAASTLETADIAEVLEEREKFVKLYEKIEHTKNLISEESVAEVAEQSNDFKKILQLVGPGVAVNILKGEMAEIAVTNTVLFERIANALINADHYKETQKELVKKGIEDFCKKHDLSQKAYQKVMNIGDDVKRTEKMEALIQKNYGFIKKIGHGLGIDGYRAKMRGMEHQRDDIKTVITQMDMDKHDIGTILRDSVVVNNPRMKQILLNTINQTKEPSAEPIASLKDLKNNCSDPEIIKSWRAFKNNDRDGLIFDSLDVLDANTPAIRDRIRNKFIATEKKAAGTKKGIWTNIFSGLFDAKLNNGKIRLMQ